MKKILLAFFFIFCFSAPAWAMAKRPDARKQPNETAAAQLSLGLWDCYEMAFHRSDMLAIKKEEVKRTLASFLEASGDAIGDANFVSTDFFQDPQKGGSDNSSVGATSLASEKRERKFTISQPLFQGFRALGGLSGAGSLKKQREQEWERAKQLLFIDVVNAYSDYLRLYKEVEIIDGIINLFQDRIKDLKGWEDIGRSRPSEIATAKSRLESFRADLAETKGDLAVARNLMAFLIGVSVEGGELKEEKTPLPADEKINVLELALQRPDVRASEQAIKTSRGALIVAQSDLWPKITLDSDLYQKREGFQSGISWDNLITFKVPLGTGGTTIGKVRDAYSDWKEAKLTNSLTRRTAEKEIQDAYDNWKSSAERYKSFEKAVKAAQENFTLQSDEYKRHLVSNLDVLSALESLFGAKRDANKAFYDVMKNYWQLEVSKGHCCYEGTGAPQS